jgi:glutathionyl-hydroquinone reductase
MLKLRRQFTQMAKWVQDDNNTGVYYVSTAVVDRWIDDAAARVFHMQVPLSPSFQALRCAASCLRI